MMEKLERIFEIEPAYDGRPASKGGKAEWRTENMKPDDGTSSTDYGISGCTLRFVLKGAKGAVQFLCFTDWYPPHVQKERYENNTPKSPYFMIEPMGADVGYHSLAPMYEGQKPMEKCIYLDGKPCYYDGSGLSAETWVKDILIKEGSEGVWKALEQKYYEEFCPLNVGPAENN